MNKLKNVKPGDLVYCINDEEEDFSGCLFMAICNNYVIVCSEYMHLEGDFDGQLAEMHEDTIEDCGVEVEIYPIDKVFLTESEVMAHMH